MYVALWIKSVVVASLSYSVSVGCIQLAIMSVFRLLRLRRVVKNYVILILRLDIYLWKIFISLYNFIFGIFMSSSVFEKIVTIVAKVVQILDYAMSVFFGESNGPAPPDS